MASSLTSCSSEASVEFYEERLKTGISEIVRSPNTLQELVAAAETIINENFSHDPRSTFTYKEDSEETLSVELDQVMLSMLACVEECGGERGKRYVASAIFACSKEEDVVGALAALGTTWLTHFLFIFKIGTGDGKLSNEQPSELATPRYGFVDFLMKLQIRDAHTCVVTGFQDFLHPNPNDPSQTISLVGAHILPRAIGTFNEKSYEAALTTFDILVNFTCLPVQTLQGLHDLIDNPSNGMTLQHDARKAFYSFKWCLKKTEQEHVYDLKILKRGGLIRKPKNNRISFVDHRNDFLSVATRQRHPPIDLPDPRYIAIHAAIAEILDLSGAGGFFDELLAKYKDDWDVPDVRSWPELETLMDTQLLNELWDKLPLSSGGFSCDSMMHRCRGMEDVTTFCLLFESIDTPTDVGIGGVTSVTSR